MTHHNPDNVKSKIKPVLFSRAELREIDAAKEFFPAAVTTYMRELILEKAREINRGKVPQYPANVTPLRRASDNIRFCLLH